jgi:hypothetical protein
MSESGEYQSNLLFPVKHTMVRCSTIYTTNQMKEKTANSYITQSQKRPDPSGVPSSKTKRSPPFFLFFPRHQPTTSIHKTSVLSSAKISFNHFHFKAFMAHLHIKEETHHFNESTHLSQNILKNNGDVRKLWSFTWVLLPTSF